MKIIGIQEVEVVTDVICNKCGDSCKASEPGCGSRGEFNGLIEAQVYGGYHSTHMKDGDCYIFSLCEKCLVEIVKDFKHPAKQYNINDPIVLDFDDENK